MPDQRLDWTQLVPTEQINPRTTDIDLLPTEAMLTQINLEDQLVPLAVKAAIPDIARVVEKVASAFEEGGHLYYVGAGTSGRLGVLDASECPPTFGVSGDLVQGIIAGGDTALRHAVEGAEDSAEEGQKVVFSLNLSDKDVLIGLSASGGAAYVIAAVKTAKAVGAFTAAITCYGNSHLAKTAHVAMVADVGPEVVAGSTRLKAGTAQKLILNMITTGAMIAWGKTYHNLMVDLKPSNIKLHKRALRLVAQISGGTEAQAEDALSKANHEVKTAIVMIRHQLGSEAARVLLRQAHGKLRAVLALSETEIQEGGS